MNLLTIIRSAAIFFAVAITPPTTAEGDRDIENLLSLETLRNGEFLPDFSYAGYRNGSTQLPRTSGTIVNVEDFGALPSDEIDDTKSILEAIEHANKIEGPVVLKFSKGRYWITGVLRIERSNFVLQGTGSGANGTVLYFPRPLKHIDKSSSLNELREYIVKLDKRQIVEDKNIDEYFSEYSWSGGFIWVQKPGVRSAPYLEEFAPEIAPLAEVSHGKRGSQDIVLSKPASLSRGDIVQLQWLNRDGPDAGIIKSLYQDHYLKAGSHHWTFPNRPIVQQTSRVIAVDGLNVTLSDPLLHDVDDGTPAQLSGWDGLEGVGLEDIHLEFPNSPYFGHHLEEGYNGIYFTSAFDSWARNIRITNADSGILSYNSANLTYQNIISAGTRRAHYAVHMGNVHNVLAENIRIFNPVRHSLTFNTQSTKCVYKNAEVFATPTLDQHAGANHQNLFDNVTLHMEARASSAGPVVPAYDGSGAGYWQPGHGSFNTTWNLNLLITAGARPDEVVTVQGLDEGPNARIFALHGNRRFKLDYRPAPYVELLNERVDNIPSLYEFQKEKRLRAE